MENEMNTDPSSEMTDADIHEELKAHGIKMHHKTGTEKLKATLASVHDGTYEAPVAEVASPTPPATAVDRTLHGTPVDIPDSELSPTDRAMQLVRIVVSPNDTLMSTYPGMIFTVGSSKVNNGRMVKKYVPFNNDEGWHVPKIIFDQIEAAEMQKFRSVKLPNGEKSLAPYITKKFNVQVLPALTMKELNDLSIAQQSRGGV